MSEGIRLRVRGHATQSVRSTKVLSAIFEQTLGRLKAGSFVARHDPGRQKDVGDPWFGYGRSGLIALIPSGLGTVVRLERIPKSAGRQTTIAMSRSATPANLKAVRTRPEIAGCSDSMTASEISPPEFRIRFLNTRTTNSGSLAMPAGSTTIHKPT